MNSIHMPRLRPLLFVAALVPACGQPQDTRESSTPKEAWNAVNDPLRLHGDYQRSFDQLPLSGRLDKTPWADSYWPSFRAGISYRWKQPSLDQFSYPTLSADQVRTATLATLARLSPAEKFDVYTGRYDFPLVTYERRRTRPNAPGWEGLCHGWAPAALLYDEPRSVIVTNADGVRIPFGATDIKALLSFYQGQLTQAPIRNLGGRCNEDLSRNPDAATRPECRDTNAGSFHVVLTNQIGLMKQGFLADVTRDAEVWNQPVFSYDSTVLGQQGPSPGAAPGTKREVRIRTIMRYTAEISPRWQAVVGTSANSTAARQYLYRVELNGAGQIIGGEWESDDRPDFLWKQEKPAFGGYLAPLATLLQASLASQGVADPMP